MLFRSSGLLPSAMLDPISWEMIDMASGGPAWGTEEFLARERRFPGWEDDDEDVRRAEEVRRQEEEKSQRNTPTASNLGADKLFLPAPEVLHRRQRAPMCLRGMHTR